MHEKNLSRIPKKEDNRLELAATALDSCIECIDALIESIRATCTMFQAGKEAEASQKFTEVIELIDLFVQLVAQVQRTLRSFDQNPPKNTDMQALEMHLLGILKALIPAKEKGDVVMLCDLLEYELVDNLIQWKIKAIPDMKALGQAKSPGSHRP